MQLNEEVTSLLLRFFVDQETTKKNASRMLNSFLFMQKYLEKDNGHFLVLILERSGILSVQMTGTRYDGGENDVRNRRKRTSNFPCYKSIVQRSTEKQRWWKIVDTLLCRLRNC